MKVSHCRLYDEGWHRIGCLFCPMASKKYIGRMEKRYPKYKAAIIRTIHRMRENGWLNRYEDLTDEECFDWWKSSKSLDSFYADLKLQMKIEFDFYEK